MRPKKWAKQQKNVSKTKVEGSFPLGYWKIDIWDLDMLEPF